MQIIQQPLGDRQCDTILATWMERRQQTCYYDRGYGLTAQASWEPTRRIRSLGSNRELLLMFGNDMLHVRCSIYDSGTSP